MSEIITLQDDAFHYKYYQDREKAFWYTEWWYFNFYDPIKNYKGMITYAVFNPGNIFPTGVASLNCAIFDSNDRSIDTDIEYFPLWDFSASYEKPDVKITSHNSLYAVDKNYMHVKGRTRNHSVEIDLFYTQDDTPVFLAKDTVSTELPWEISSWLVYMPSAKVEGVIKTKDENIQIQGIGYHDHDWGIWYEFMETWKWAHFSIPSKNIAFVVGLQAAFQKSPGYFRYGDVTFRFYENDYKVEFGAYETWEVLYSYPTEISFELTTTGSDGKEYRLLLHWSVLLTSVLWRYPVIVFEQTAAFKGQLYQKKDTNWELVETIDTQGFCESTSTWYSPLEKS